MLYSVIVKGGEVPERDGVTLVHTMMATGAQTLAMVSSDNRQDIEDWAQESLLINKDGALLFFSELQ